MSETGGTLHQPEALAHAEAIPSFTVVVTAGPDAGKSASTTDGRLTVGTAEGAALALSDPKVSRFHVDFEAAVGGVAVRDVGSKNGTVINGLVIREAFVNANAIVRIGDTELRLELTAPQPPSTDRRDGFGELVGSSPVMQSVYRVLEQAAPTDAPILINGESGTGKELAARAVHEASRRSKEPFEVVDCGGLPPTLIESALFGHERGAFTGAVNAQEGAFERAAGGTIFLDELGELPLEVQPKLLRALGEGEIRRLGGRKSQKVDVRIVAATNRDLRREVNDGRFRADLFYRLAVIQVRMPALRDRTGDIPRLAHVLLSKLQGRPAEAAQPDALLDAALLATLSAHSWPGNVRELRNYLEQLLVLRQPPPLEPTEPASAAGVLDGLTTLSMPMAKQQLLERFDRLYVSSVLERASGNVAEAARMAGVDRRTLFRLMQRHGLRRP